MTAGTSRWSVFDAMWALLAGFFAVGVVLGFLGRNPTTEDVFLIILPAQELAVVGTVWLISRRKGTGDLRDDFGIEFARRDWIWLVGGIALQLALSWLVAQTFDVDEAPQEIARLADEASGTAAIAALVMTVILVPAVEELVFRGLLLRGIQRRLGVAWAVVISAGVFALFHYTGRATLPILPALFVVGVALGLVAVRTGRLGAAMVLHAGFNLVPAVVLFG